MNGHGERKLPRQRAMRRDQECRDPGLLTRRHAAFGIERSEKCAHDGARRIGRARRWS